MVHVVLHRNECSTQTTDQLTSPGRQVQATTDPDQATATQTAARNLSPDNANQIQHSVRPVITVRKRTTSNPIVLKGRETMPRWYK